MTLNTLTPKTLPTRAAGPQPGVLGFMASFMQKKKLSRWPEPKKKFFLADAVWTWNYRKPIGKSMCLQTEHVGCIYEAIV